MAFAVLLTVPVGGQTFDAVDIGTFGSFNLGSDVNGDGVVVGAARVGEPPVGGYSAAYIAIGGQLIDIGNFGGRYASASGITDGGVVVGWAETNYGWEHPFSYSNGVMTDLGTLGGQYGRATGVNASGVIVGASSLPSFGGPHAFSYSNGQMNDLGTLGGDSSGATGINRFGAIVGYSYLSDNSKHAFLYQDGRMVDLGTLEGHFSEAAAINDNGIVVGSAETFGRYHAFRFTDGLMADLGTLGGPSSIARAINNSGDIVGYSAMPGDTTFHAFLYHDGVMTDLNTLLSVAGVTLSDATAINDLGQIVAIGADQHTYLLSMIPEPSTYAITLGVATLGFTVIRRRK